MKLICDLHCDLPTKVLNEKQTVKNNNCHWSLDKCPSDAFLQFFACYVDKKQVQAPFLYVNQMLSKFKMNFPEEMTLAYSGNEMDKALDSGKSVGILAIEGGEALEGNLENLSHFYRQGVRLMTLTWNHENELGYGVGTDEDTSPLKSFGLQVLKKMNSLSMIVDVSHLNEGGFWSVAENASKPFVASHSNAQKICNHKRNLTDEQILCIIRSGGLIGLNLYPPFLNNSNRATVKHILQHIEHFLELGAEDALAFGCDFDGIDCTPIGINDVSGLNTIINEMQKNNFSDEQIAKICYKNCKRFVKNAIL